MTKRSDWSRSAEFKRFARHILKDTVPKIAGSAYTIVIAPQGGIADVKIAVELGYTILLDKPLVVFAPKGRTVADRLLRIADHVITADMETDEGRAEAERQLLAYLKQ